MKNIFKILLILFFSSLLFAEKITIINENSNAEIYLNGQKVGIGNVYNYETTPGTHHLKVKLDNKTIYSKIISVNKNESTAVNTSLFINAEDSDILNVEPAEIEAKRIAKSKGNLGIGYQLGPDIFGLSVRYWAFERVGLQVLGWGSNDDNSTNAVSGRFIYLIKNKLAKKDILHTIYTGISFGSSLEKNHAVSFFSNESKDIDKSITEIFLGFEYPTRFGLYSYLEMAYTIVNQKETFSTSTTTKTHNGLKLNLGLHFYF